MGAPRRYEHKSCIDSGYKAKSFGASFRAYDHVWYRDCERANLGRCSPGPGPSPRREVQRVQFL